MAEAAVSSMRLVRCLLEERAKRLTLLLGHIGWDVVGCRAVFPVPDRKVCAMSDKPAERLDALEMDGHMYGRNSVTIDSVHVRPQVLKLGHALSLPTRRCAMHEAANQKSVGIRANPKPSKQTYFLNIPTLNRGDHPTRTDREAPDQPGNQHCQKAGDNCNT